MFSLWIHGARNIQGQGYRDPALGEFPFVRCFACEEMGTCPDHALIIPEEPMLIVVAAGFVASVENFKNDLPPSQSSKQIVTVGSWEKRMSANYR